MVSCLFKSCCLTPQLFLTEKGKATTKREAIVAEITEVMHLVNVEKTTDMWTDDYRKGQLHGDHMPLHNIRFQVEE